MRRVALTFAVAFLLAATGTAQTITTLAGNGGDSYFCGDGGPATDACLAQVQGVAVNAAGDVFIADYNNNRVRRVDAAGTITTFAGNGTHGLCGDGGPATSACLDSPQDVTVDRLGNVFIADTDNHRIRKVNMSAPYRLGYISTVIGGQGEPTGVAVDTSGNVFFVDWQSRRVRKVDGAGTVTTVAGGGHGAYFCGDGGPATSACLLPYGGLAVDGAGNLFIPDQGNGRIRRVDAVTGIITTVAGGGPGYPVVGFCGDDGPATNACLNSPRDVALDAAGNLYIADAGNHRIRKVDVSGVITTVAGNGTRGYCGDGGPPPTACLNVPVSIAVDASGTLYIADMDNHRVRKVEPPDDLASFRLSKALLSGCLTTTGTVTLTAPAPAGGLVVALHSDNPHAVVPPSLVVKADALSKTFRIVTQAVAVSESATVEASVPGQVLSATLTLIPMAPKSVLLTPNPVVSGTTVAGQVTLECPAGPGDIVVTLFSTKPLVAAPTTTSIIVPVGTKVMPFAVTTNPVTVVTKPAIKATANGVTKSKALVVNPAP